MNRPALGRFAAYVLVVVAGAAGMWRVETTADRAREAAADAQEALDQLEADRLAAREAACLNDDDTNTRIRRMSRDAPIELGEALIEVAGGDGEPPDPVVVDQFRKVMQRRLDGIVNQLPARKWDPEAQECVDVPLDTGG